MRKFGAKIIISIMLILILITLCVFGIRGIAALLNGSKLDAGESDPMFAEPVEIVTRPPEIDAEEQQEEHPTLDDYIDSESTPLD